MHAFAGGTPLIYIGHAGGAFANMNPYARLGSSPIQGGSAREGIMTYAYDAIAMSQPSTLDPFRVATSLAFQHTHDDDDVLIDASTLTLEGPRGAAEFASMYALYCATGIMPDKLHDAMSIMIGSRGRGAHNPAAQRQMISILRWLLACAGYGEDVLMDAIASAIESARMVDRAATPEGWLMTMPLEGEPHPRSWGCTVGEVMAHTPAAIETTDWARREPQHSATPIEWLE